MRIDHPDARVAGTAEPSRAIDLSMEIAAPFDAVWSALTDAKELINWFPLEARVRPPSLDNPADRGAIWMSWGGEFQFESPIEVWEPFKRLRVIQREPAVDGPMPNPQRMTVEYRIDARSPAMTVLRLIHDGFPSGREWEELFDSTQRGWRFQLDALKLYLEMKQGESGRARKVVYARCSSTTRTREELWKRLVGGGGLGGMKALDRLRAGEDYQISLPGDAGDTIAGIAQLVLPPREFRGSIEQPARGVLRLHIDDLLGRRDAYLWIALFGSDEQAVSLMQHAADDLMKRM